MGIIRSDMPNRRFPVIGGPYDGNTLTEKEWRDMGFPEYGGYLPFNVASKSGRSYYDHSLKNIAVKYVPTRIFVHESAFEELVWD